MSRIFLTPTLCCARKHFIFIYWFICQPLKPKLHLPLHPFLPPAIILSQAPCSFEISIISSDWHLFLCFYKMDLAQYLAHSSYFIHIFNEWMRYGWTDWCMGGQMDRSRMLCRSLRTVIFYHEFRMWNSLNCVVFFVRKIKQNIS